MPALSFDGQSLMIDGRRLWLVSGAIHYPRTPRELWRSRIRAAKQAGLNCIETYVFWNVHEPRPGVFNFTGDADLRHFIQLIGEEGLCCILRPGPYICAEWDFGGLPAWLHRVEGVRLRQAGAPFMEAVARYLTAVMEQVADLQASHKPGAPIVLMQAENEWFCDHKQEATAYLGEIVRYLREGGCRVPISMCNNLWARLDGVIDTWNAKHRLTADLRQLRVVQPRAPRIVSEFWPSWFDIWDEPHQQEDDAQTVSYRLAQILAAGTQFNIYPFHGGTSFGFYAGRGIAKPDAFVTTSFDYDAPLREAGRRGEKYDAVKRIATFAASFGQLFASLDPAEPDAIIAPDEDGSCPSVVHLRGSQGEVVFILRPRGDKSEKFDLLLSNGETLPVPMGDDRAAWVVLNANLGGIAKLNSSNLRPFAFAHRRLLVLFGPAGADGVVKIDGAALHLRVPAAGEPPLVRNHEPITLVVLNPEQVDAAYINGDGLFIGAAGLDDENRPIPRRGWPSLTTISITGQMTHAAQKPPRLPATPRLGDWTAADVDHYITGVADAFTPIDGPASLESQGVDFGYAWYRITLEAPARGTLLAPRAADRIHLFTNGKPAALLGLGPGADNDPQSLALAPTTVALADNLGRFNYGWNLGESKGLFGHLCDVKPIKLGKPTVHTGRAPDAFVLSRFITGMRAGDRPPADALAWTVKSKPGLPLVLDISGFAHRCMLLVNNKPVALYDPTYSAALGRWQLDAGPGGQLKKTGTNELRLALFTKLDRPADLSPIRLWQVTSEVTSDAQWAFAPWTVPPPEAFTKRTAGSTANRPTWYRCEFRVTSTPGGAPLWLEPLGMSKGQLFLNGHNVGRYWLATADGTAVPPQTRYYLPEPWIKRDAPNELLLFDEHGNSPSKCRLIYD